MNLNATNIKHEIFWETRELKGPLIEINISNILITCDIILGKIGGVNKKNEAIFAV